MEFQTAQKTLDYIQKKLCNNFDVAKKVFSHNNLQIGILYISTIIDENLLSEMIFKPLLSINNKIEKIEDIRSSFLNTCKIKTLEITSLQEKNNEIIKNILEGYVFLCTENCEKVALVGIEKFPSRNPEEPPTSSVVFGPRVGFVEAIDKNISLIRKRLVTEKLKFDVLTIGKYTQTKVVISYLTDIANKKVVKQIKQKLEKIEIDGIIDSYYITSYFQKGAKVFKRVGLNEKPDITVSKMLEGRIAILVDGSPIVLTLPFLIFEDLQNSNDYYTNAIYASIIRFIRFIGILVAVIIPGIYLSLRLYHFKILPLKYLITISNSTQELPFTPFIELIFILLLFQILYEVSLRLPRYLGLATSIVGALILGQTGVNAGLISPPGVVIIAMSIIAAYVVPEQISQVTIFRALFLLIGGTIGILGIVGLSIYLINYMASLSNFGSPYLAPYAPRIKQDLKDGLVKKEQNKMRTRPKSLNVKNKVRSK